MADQRVVESHACDAVVAVEDADARDGHLHAAFSAQLRVQVFDDPFDGDPRGVFGHAGQDSL